MIERIALLFHAERGEEVHDGVWMSGGKQATFQSILDAAYFALVTVSTVGYGDMVVTTPLGKMVASLTMISGMVCISAIVSIISGEMGRLQQLQRLDVLRCGRRELLLSEERTTLSLQHLGLRHLLGLGTGDRHTGASRILHAKSR